MAWQQVSPRYVRQDYPQLHAQWYCDSVPRGGGELMVWVDGDGRIAAFQLSHEEWPAMRHYIAHWNTGCGLRTGMVDDGVSRRRVRKPAPLIRFSDPPDPEAARRLLEYFRENASPLEPQQRLTITAVLGEATY